LIAVIATTTMVVSRSSGKVTYQKRWNRPAPSMRAASSTSREMVCSPARNSSIGRPALCQAAATKTE
jgi:hypothetical protein